MEDECNGVCPFHDCEMRTVLMTMMRMMMPTRIMMSAKVMRTQTGMAAVAIMMCAAVKASVDKGDDDVANATILRTCLFLNDDFDDSLSHVIACWSRGL